MSKKNFPAKPEAVYTPELVTELPTKELDAAPVLATAWVVLEDRTVAISGSITRVRAGKVAKDALIARRLADQGVKLEARSA